MTSFPKLLSLQVCSGTNSSSFRSEIKANSGWPPWINRVGRYSARHIRFTVVNRRRETGPVDPFCATSAHSSTSSELVGRIMIRRLDRQKGGLRAFGSNPAYARASALPPKADIGREARLVRLVPIADMAGTTRSPCPHARVTSKVVRHPLLAPCGD
jgi:hypothetical protein